MYIIPYVGPEYKPPNINGWLWSASRVKIDATNKPPVGWTVSTKLTLSN